MFVASGLFQKKKKNFPFNNKTRRNPLKKNEFFFFLLESGFWHDTLIVCIFKIKKKYLKFGILIYGWCCTV